ncbi:MAG: RNA-binding S4 domain-containing protein [Opitutaceae bacterium]
MSPTAAPALDSDSSASRLDKWLWAVRVFKTRPLATEACRRGMVEINGLVAKPARAVHPGEVVVIQQPQLTRTLRVVAVPPSRVGAKLLADFLVELTPPAEFQRQRERGLQHVLERPKGAGRPTKRERRSIDRFFN